MEEKMLEGAYKELGKSMITRKIGKISTMY